MHVRSITGGDAPWVRGLLRTHFAGPRIASRGVWFDADALPGLIAEERKCVRSMLPPVPVGVLVHTPMQRAEECEIIALAATQPHRGVGTVLLHEAVRLATATGVRRLFLTTSNDNLDALRFYQRHGWRMVAVHRGSIERAREHKPDIPLTGHYGIAVRDEVELEWSE